MATDKPDIFVGSYVRVALNRDTTSEIPSYFDPGYIETKNLAAFPSVEVGHEIEGIEDYREDFTTKLVGNAVVKDTSISVLDVPDDDFINELETALLEKRKLRFRNLYVIDTGNGEKSQNGLYHIFDAYVQKSTTSGSSDSVVTRTYNLSPEGKVFQGFAQVGEILRQGDFGVGAGTEEIPGVKDIGALTGNRWVTVDASNSQNPFGSDTSAMAIQHPNNLGWEIIGQTVGAPAIRIRNKKLKSDGSVEASKWVKVYSETDKPQAADNDFVSKANGGSYVKGVTFESGLRVQATGSGGMELVNGGTDGASLNGVNAKIKTWWGLGFESNSGSNGITIAFDLRNGNITTKGGINSNNQISVAAAIPTADSHLTRKDYVDNGLNRKINIGSTIDFGIF